MANPNKTVAKARHRMGGFAKREPSPARKAEQEAFSAFMGWCVKQYEAGRSFDNVEAAQVAYEAERNGEA